MEESFELPSQHLMGTANSWPLRDLSVLDMQQEQELSVAESAAASADHTPRLSTHVAGEKPKASTEGWSPDVFAVSAAEEGEALQDRRSGSSTGRVATGASPTTAGAPRDMRFKRPAHTKDAERPTHRGPTRPKKRASPNAVPKPLLPVTEKKSLEENKLERRARKNTGDSEKPDIAPDNTSAGREGRQFAVANVGNNGRIYLRPTIRPAHLRSPQPTFVFPMTPPSTAGLDAFASEKSRTDEAARKPQPSKLQRPQQRQTQREVPSLLFGSDWTPEPASSPTALPIQGNQLFATEASRATYMASPAALRSRGHPGHRRALSDSTVPDTSVAHESDPGGFKVVITQPADEQRAKTLEDLHHHISPPFLEIAIPSWKLGTPRFTLRGTPVIRSSSYAPTEEIRSSRRSYLNQVYDRITLDREVSVASQRGFLGGVQIPSSPQMPRVLSDAQAAIRQKRATFQSADPTIEPAMFDDLTFKPASDDHSIVRFSPSTLCVTAATPSRLVAEITSPKFMDYDLVSDFFLTYRSFLEPSDLLRMLIARMRWAIERDDEVGMVVRVRTFVALRHWILNYFMDDFVIDYDLRLLFCSLLNAFVDELSNDARGRKVQLKILTELKKCWRRSCSQYWDGDDFDDALGPEVPIYPGGIAGHRNPALDPTFWEQGGLDGNDLILQRPSSDVDSIPDARSGAVLANSVRAGNIDSMILDGRPITPDSEDRQRVGRYVRHQASPTSMASIDFVSCSFPTKNMRLVPAGMANPMAAHPAVMMEPSGLMLYNSTGPVATTPRSLVGKRVRPGQPMLQTVEPVHRRNNSLTDSLRERSPTPDGSPYPNSDILLPIPFAGNLVRGAIFPPGQPYVDVLPGANGERQTTILEPDQVNVNVQGPQKEKASAMSGQGMKKLLGSVRRALSTKGQAVPPSQGNFINISPIGPRGATTNRLPGTAIVPQARPRMNGSRPPVRIDLLGAKIAEDFKAAVREDATSEAGLSGGLSGGLNLHYQQHQDQNSPQAAPGASSYSDSLLIGPPAVRDGFLRPISDAGITSGSKSIVIVNDTLPLGFPVMTGALPAAESSVEAFAESFIPRTIDPTPPTTPPGHGMGTPRRSSYILDTHALRTFLSADPLPSFAPDMATLGSRQAIAGSSALPSSDALKQTPELENVRPAMNREINGSTVSPTATSPMPRVAPTWARGHARNVSSRSRRSGRSLSRNRFASFTSGIAPQVTMRSFDASTYSGASIDDSFIATGPQPRRVLRRRPGGNLRAATNVVDLDHGLMRRSRSVGSLTTYTDSIRSSYMRSQAPDSVVDGQSRDKNELFSLGAIAEKNSKRPLSLFSTHSSKPVMRPSFEVEAQKLARIPDDTDDDGGVEAALLKLEGRFGQKESVLREEPSLSATARPSPTLAPSDGLALDSISLDGTRDGPMTKEEKLQHRLKRVRDNDMATNLPIPSDDRMPINGAVKPLFRNGRDGQDGQDSHITEDRLRGNRHIPAPSSPPVFSPPPPVRPTNVPHMADDTESSLSTESDESYSSIPLLDRGLTDEDRSHCDTTDEWGERSVFRGGDSGGLPTPTAEASMARVSHPESYEIVNKTESIGQIPPGDTMPSTEGFLDDDGDIQSDLSSEMSAEVVDGEDDDAIIYGQAPPRAPTRLQTHALGSPLVESARGQYHAHGQGDSVDGMPSSPPLTLAQALQMSPETANIPRIHDHQVWGQKKPLPPTPSTAVPSNMGVKKYSGNSSEYMAQGSLTPRAAGSGEVRTTISETRRTVDSDASRKFSVHLPFILAFESDVLAQQFTLIEKDALHEIDWKELIEMRWKNAEHSDARSWVDFLRNSEARGVEVVIARFNLMVKWAISEVVLTQDREERARCLIKFIHIASHCRKYRNFATMSQLTMALASKEVSRLKQTWGIVPPSDVRTLRDLETLVSPMRNFYCLRAEMEAVEINNADSGCIPFVGIYTHDLMFNAQRPSEVASSPSTPPLVNFERCRCTATVVKTLLRLVEASAQYTFQPIEGITERCLWMSALSDENIRKNSDALE